jgi:peptidoglycan hydrolase-like protein with peptidoglycan-binding domain
MRNVVRRVAYGVLGTGMIVTMAAGATTAAGAAVAAPHRTVTKSQVVKWITVKEGAAGNRVRTIQYLLNDHGFAVPVTGDFLSQTKAQVKAFQTKEKLKDDGVVSDKTWDALIVKDLGKGSTHKDAVEAVQSYLNRAYGYTSLKVDGKYGDGTEAAVKGFQTKYKLKVKSGTVDLDTWKALVFYAK